MAEIFKKMKDYFFADPAQVDSEEMEQEFPEDLNLPSFEEEPQPERRRGKVVNMPNPNVSSTAGMSAMHGGANLKMIVYQPMSYEDSQAIVDNLRANKPVIVNMVDLERECAQRVLDFMAGAVYALGGTIRKVSFGIFVIVPSNVSLVGNGEDEGKDVFRT